MASLLRRFLVLALCAFAVSAPRAENDAVNGTAGAERSLAESQLRRAVAALSERGLDAALGEIDRLVARYPNFRLAHLVRGDLLLARARPISVLGDAGRAGDERLDDLRIEAERRLNGHLPARAVPRYLVSLAPGERHVIVIDASRSRLFVYENSGGTPRLVEDYYFTQGKNGVPKQLEGDRKTPIGVYFVTRQISGAKLPDLYGWGAFPINYPNAWDRLRGRTGYGIWLHGVPSDTYARAPLASDGCVALANPEIADLAKRIQVGVTPVVTAERIEWTSPEALRAERKAFLARIARWQADWESLDIDRYLSNYSSRFRTDDMDLEAFTTHKRRVNAGKRWIKLSLENLSAYRSPEANGPVVVTFDQLYRSSNLSQRSRKRQYWVPENGDWKIVYEAQVAYPPVRLPASYADATR